jgi:hypothetical protein
MVLRRAERSCRDVRRWVLVKVVRVEDGVAWEVRRDSMVWSVNA